MSCMGAHRPCGCLRQVGFEHEKTKLNGADYHVARGKVRVVGPRALERNSVAVVDHVKERCFLGTTLLLQRGPSTTHE